MNQDILFSKDANAFFSSPVRAMFRNTDLGSIISFAGGYPSPEAIPVAEINGIMNNVINRYGAKAMQYGATEGVAELRNAIAGRYGVSSGNVRISTSSQQGIDVCTRIYIDPGDVILATNPTFLGALQSFRSYRAEIAGIGHDDNADTLAGAYISRIEELKRAGRRIKLMYLIPDFQNPSGETLSLEARIKLTEIARKNNIMIIEDSPYRELRYEGKDIPTMYSIAPDCVIHLGSFSKIMAPGFRIGWIIADEKVLEKISECKQSIDLCAPVFDQYVAAGYIESGILDKNLKKAIALYKGQRDLMLAMLEKEMPETVTWTRPEGGLFLFLKLPENIDATALCGKALEKGVAYVAGSLFHPDGSGRNTIRLNYSFTTPEKIRKGISILAGLIRESI